MEAYLKLAFSELYTQDGLTVMARGVGLVKLFCKFIEHYATCSSESGKCPHLVFCLNSSELEFTIKNAIFSDGSQHLPKVITSDISVQERMGMYSEGGCFIITSRIMIVDLLDKKLDAKSISGLLIYDAHRYAACTIISVLTYNTYYYRCSRIIDTSMEAFIIRVYRENNRVGFIKAFSEDPEAFQMSSSKVEDILKLLYVDKLYLWPRFRPELASVLEKSQPVVCEYSSDLTHHMKAIQKALLVAMNSCMSEIKKSCPNINSEDFTLENGLYKSFDISLRYQLDQEWHKISFRTKQLVLCLHWH
jgi:DNA excision repair protein ERCC-4